MNNSDSFLSETLFRKFLHPGLIPSDPGTDQSGTAGGGWRTAEQRKVHCLACGWCCSPIFPVNTSAPQSAAVVCRFHPSRRRWLYRRLGQIFCSLETLSCSVPTSSSLDEWTLASSRPVFPHFSRPFTDQLLPTAPSRFVHDLSGVRRLLWLTKGVKWQSHSTGPP